jgi:hypothetical protein
MFLTPAQDLVRKYDEVSQKFNDASIDLESERSYKRELHKETAKWQKQFEYLQKCVMRKLTYLDKDIALIRILGPKLVHFDFN